MSYSYTQRSAKASIRIGGVLFDLGNTLYGTGTDSAISPLADTVKPIHSNGDPQKGEFA